MTINTTANAKGLRRRAVLATALAAIGWAGAAEAAPGDLVDLTVVDRETGRPLEVWRQRGRAFVAGQPGDRYSLRVTNNTGGRVLVVMSVDGVNVLTGETAGYRQRGYVFEPYQSYDVSGWRKSNTAVAAFTFASLPNSYAARTGRPGDVGVIGIAAFREWVPPPVPPSPTVLEESRASPNSRVDEVVVTGSRIAPSEAPRAAAQPRREEKLGTGHGAREWSVARQVTFERATAYPELTRQIEYDTYANLAALGVIPRPPIPGHRPRPFPTDGGYVPDPPGAP